MNQENLKQESREKSQGLVHEVLSVSQCEIQEEDRNGLALDQTKRALASNLVEEICSDDNLRMAYKRVISNKGAPGIDGMTVEHFPEFIKQHKCKIVEVLKTDKYKPRPVRIVEIPKPNGGTRKLGIPIVLDRFVQQAVYQVLEKLLDKDFSPNSYGFRKGKSAHQAVIEANRHISEGNRFVVDIDIESFFDRINHDRLMARLATYTDDKILLKLIRRFLQSGIMQNGVKEERNMGTPQGSPLSPLLANLVLDELDKELEKRGHKFCRYADDCNIFKSSRKAAERVKEYIETFLNSKMKLKVNRDKSKIGTPTKITFLGYTTGIKSSIIADKKSISRLKYKVRTFTRRTRGVSIYQIIGDLNEYIRGWKEYFKLDKRKGIYEDIDSWIRRRLRCYLLKQKKKYKTIKSWLISLGINIYDAMNLAFSSKGWWRLSISPQLSIGLPIKWFTNQGLASLQNKL